MNPNGKGGCSSNDVMHFAGAVEGEARKLFSTREQDMAQDAISALQDYLMDIQKAGGKECAGRVFALIANETAKLPGLRLDATMTENNGAAHIEIQPPLGEQLLKRDFTPVVSAHISDLNFGSVIISQGLYQLGDSFLQRSFKDRTRFQALAGTDSETGRYSHITEEIKE